MSNANRCGVLGRWMADRGYDAWNIFIGEMKWCRLVAMTKDPIGVMLGMNMTADINWDIVRAVKLT